MIDSIDRAALADRIERLPLEDDGPYSSALPRPAVNIIVTPDMRAAIVSALRASPAPAQELVEQVLPAAIAAYNAIWEADRPVTAETAVSVRHTAMRAALYAILPALQPSARERMLMEALSKPSLMRAMCGARERCSCAGLNDQWRSRHCDLIEAYAVQIRAALDAAGRT